MARHTPPTLAFERALFHTLMQREYRRLGIVPQSARIIHGGADTSLHGINVETPHGVDTVAAVRRTPHPRQGRPYRNRGAWTAGTAGPIQRDALTIAGTGDDGPSFRRLVQELRLETRVTFCGHQSREALRNLYQEADVLVFPSLWQEPFGHVSIEAMAAGLVVVGDGDRRCGGNPDARRQRAGVPGGRDAAALAKPGLEARGLGAAPGTSS